MSDLESSFVTKRSTPQPRHPHQEIAELLATAIIRVRAKNHPNQYHVSLGFTGNQSVNANSSYTKGVQE